MAVQLRAYYDAFPFGLGFSFGITLCIPLDQKAVGVSSCITSRGQSPSYGDGPYFKSVVQGHPEDLYISPDYGEYYQPSSGSTFKVTRVAQNEVYWEQWQGGRLIRTSRRTVNISPNGSDYNIQIDYVDYYPLNGSTGYYTWRLENVIAKGHYTVRTVSWVPTPFAFKYGEDTAFNTWCDIGVYMHPYASLFSTAYVTACSQIPSITVNAIEGVLECIDTLRWLYTLANDPIHGLRALVAESQQNPGDLWLSYRYQFTTTRLDLREIKRGYNAILKLKSLTQDEYSVVGRAADGPISVGAKVTFKICDLVPQSYEELLRQYGMVPSAADMWDIIPLSFVVDWFAQIGGILENFGNFSNSLRLRPSAIWYTVKTNYQGQSTFFRIPGKVLNIPPKYEFYQPSGKTVKMRIADYVTLFCPH